MSSYPWQAPAVEKCYEVHSVICDILYEAERGKITWMEALEQMRNELQNAKLEDDEDDS